MTIGLLALLEVAVIRSLSHFLRRRGSERRLGLLPIVSVETARADRLRQLGEAGTYRVHNCGKILHVDYDRGVLIVEREARHVR